MEQTVKSLSELMSTAMKSYTDSKPKSIIPNEAEVISQGQELIRSGYQPIDQDVFGKLCRYLAAPNGQGLFLYGKVGTGKTFFFKRMFSRLEFANTVQLSEAYKSTGGRINGMFWYESYWICDSETDRHSLVIDDLGTEPKTNIYGTVTELLVDVIDQRYRDWQKTGVKTYFTSNLNSKELDVRYGRRATDRIAEMCAAIEFTGNSIRGLRKQPLPAEDKNT